MARKRFLSIALAALVFLHPTLAADISDKWTASINTMVGEMNYTFEFKVEGEKLTGKAASSLGGESDLTEGRVNGDEISFVEIMKTQGQELKFAYKGKISGDEIRFSRSIGVMAEEFVAIRAVRVPSAVAIARPTAEEVQLAERSLAKLLQTADPVLREINQKYPGLISVKIPPPNSAIVPSLVPFFQNKHQANLEVAKQGDIDILFMGDSITDNWREDTAGKPVFDKYFGQMKIANFGISGDSTQGVLYRLRHGEGQGFSPKAVMLMIGTNNTSRNTAAEIAEAIGAIVLEMQRDYPKVKILLLGIFPRSTANDSVRAKIAEINRTISRLDDGDRVFYMDIGAKFLDADGNIPKEIMSDGLHPTTKGYEIWAEAVKEPLAALAGK
jgi:lysophospholipase L1-like esterase